MKNLRDGEELKQISNYPDYWISNHGRVWSTYGRGRWLKGGINCDGYHLVSLCNNSKRKTHFVHRLVAETFLENLSNYRCVLHGDGDPLNNHVENLRFGSDKMNYQDAVKHGTSNRGERHGRSKLTADNVREIKKLLATSNITHREIGERFGVKHQTISHINTGYRWSHIEI